MIHRLVFCFLFIFTAAALADDQKSTAGTSRPADTPIPHSDVFARDRPAGAGFSTPKQATSEFMHTLLAAKNDLLRDDAFKRQFLSAKLRQRIAAALQQYENLPITKVHYNDHPAAPDPTNGAFTNSLETPTSYTLATGHADGDQAAYEVKYHWGAGYTFEGDRRTTTVILAREDGRWYVDDLYTHPGKNDSPRSFYESLVLPTGLTTRSSEPPLRSGR